MSNGTDSYSPQKGWIVHFVWEHFYTQRTLQFKKFESINAFPPKDIPSLLPWHLHLVSVKPLAPHQISPPPIQPSPDLLLFFHHFLQPPNWQHSAYNVLDYVIKKTKSRGRSTEEEKQSGIHKYFHTQSLKWPHTKKHVSLTRFLGELVKFIFPGLSNFRFLPHRDRGVLVRVLYTCVLCWWRSLFCVVYRKILDLATACYCPPHFSGHVGKITVKI